MLRTLVHKTLRLYSKTAYGLRSKVTAQALPTSQAPLPAQPIPAAWVLSGAPQATAQFLTVSGDEGLVTGVWHCTAGRFRWHFDYDEVVHILEGGVHIEHDGQELELGPGSVAFFPVGSVSIWTVRSHVRKLFVHRHPASLAKQLLKPVLS